MGFKGDLNTFNLANIFQTLSMNRQTGTLAIYNKKSNSEGFVLFEDGLIRQVALTKSAKVRFGEILLRTGMMSSEDLERSLAVQRTTKELLGDILVRTNLLTREQILETLRFQQEETLYELFAWQEALFEFSEQFPVDTVFDADISKYNLLFNTNSILMEAMRRLDEWSRIRQYLPSEREIPVLIVKPEDDVLDESQKTIVSLINGINNAKKICTLSFLGNFIASQILADLIKTGYVRLKETNELIQTGYDCLRNGFYEDGISILTLVLINDAWQPDVVERLAEAYRAIGDSDKSKERFKEVVKYYFDRGEYPKAVEVQTEILNLDTRDYNERVLLADLYVAGKSANKAAEEYRTALKSINSKNEPDLFIEVSEKLIKTVKSDIRVREELVETLLRINRKEVALAHLSELAVLHSSQGNYKAAIDIYHRMVQIAPENQEFRGKLEKLVDLEGKRRKRKLQIVRVCVLLVLLFSVAGLALGYVVHTRVEFAKAEKEALKFVEEGKYLEATNRIEEFILNYPLAPTFSKAKERMTEFSELERNRRERIADDLKKKTNAAIKKANDFKNSLPAEDSRMKVEEVEEQLALLMKESEFEEEKRIYVQVESRIKNINKTITDMISQFEDSLKNGKHAEAHSIVTALASTYTQSKRVSEIRIPVYVDCNLPSDADVSVDGKLIGKVPQLLLLQQKIAVDVVVSARGFAPLTIRLMPEEKPTYRITLERMHLWRVKATSTGSFESRPLLINNDVYCVTRNGTIYVLDRNSGATKQTYSIEELTGNKSQVHDVTANSVYSSGLLYIPSLDGNLYAVDISKRTLAWHYEVKDFIRSEPAIFDSPKHGKKVIAFGAENGNLYCLSADKGELLWSTQTKGPVLSSPVYESGFIYFTSRDFSIYKVSVIDGSIAKKLTSSAAISATPEIFGDTICFGNELGDFYLLNKADLSVVKVIRLATAMVVGRPVKFGNFVIVATTAQKGDDREPGRIIMINLVESKIAATFSFNGKASSQPIIFNNELYCASSTGAIICFKLTDTGALDLQWKYDSDSRIICDPLFSPDLVVYVTERGVALAFQ